MKIVNIQQGSDAWHQHRAQHLNASDAPAMMGCSPYKTRAQLVRQVATGIVPEVDAATEQRFKDGHRYEALARPLAEQIVGEDLFPVTGTEGKYSASFDGLTLLEDVAFEHKSLNDALRAAMVEGCTGADLPLLYRVQMEHQLMVSGAERVLFMASKWDDDGSLIEERHCWYTPNAELRARIVAGWEQFEADVAAYEPERVSAPVVAAAQVEGFGTLSLRVEGRVLASNLDAFKAGAEAFIARLPKPEDLQTDQDFVNADAAVKACAEAESRIKAAKDAALSQMADVETVMRTADSVHDAIRAARLALEKVVKAEKENRRNDIVAKARDSVIEHYRVINESLGEHAIGIPASLTAEIGASIKGKKSLSSMRDAVDSVAANAKIAASQQADRVRANMAILAGHQDHSHLFADRVQLCATKAPDDLRNLIAARIAEHQLREREREEAQRERIRQEEAARLERELQQRDMERIRDELEAQKRAAFEQSLNEIQEADKADMPVEAPAAAPTTTAAQAPAAAVRPGARIKLGDINLAIAPMKIDADGLAQLGFNPLAQDRAAKLYDASQLPAMCKAMQTILEKAAGEGYRLAA